MCGHLADLAGDVCTSCGQQFDASKRVAEFEEELLNRVGADRLAYECAIAALSGVIRRRTRLTDALEDYLQVGCIDGPKTVPAWVQQYEAKAARKEAES